MAKLEYFLCYMLLGLYTVDCYTLDEVTRLKKMLFTNYDKGIRPIYNQSKPIAVYLRKYIQSINKFDLSNGQLDTVGYMITTWHDERIVWNETEFAHIESIGLDGNEIWHPNIAQFNAMADEVTLDSLLVFSNGIVSRVVIRKFYTFCQLNMRYYPEDKHDCSYHFVSMKYRKGEISLLSATMGVSDLYLLKHGEWEISDTSVYVEDSIQEDLGFQAEQLVYTFVLSRQPSFSMLHRSVPLGIVAICVLFIYMVPLTSGERISYAVTLFLSIIFWQAIVADDLPKNSAQISIFSIIITAILCLTGTSTIASVILVRMVSNKSNYPVPAPLQRLALRRRPKRNSKPNFFRQISNLSSIVYGHRKDKTEKAVHSESSQPNGNAVYESPQLPSPTKDCVEGPETVSWLEAANAVDVLLFYIHLVLFVLSFIAFNLIFALS